MIGCVPGVNSIGNAVIDQVVVDPGCVALFIDAVATVKVRGTVTDVKDNIVIHLVAVGHAVLVVYSG